MKRKTMNLTLALLCMLLWASCTKAEGIDEPVLNAQKSSELQEWPGSQCTFDGVLSPEEIKGLQLMREEEKLAHDIYQSFAEKYNALLFSNIARSENAHTSAVLRLLEGYGLEDPAMEESGTFSNPDLQKLYDELLTQGSESLVEALKVGARIEDLDIFDLKQLLGQTQNEDVKRVYTNLLRASGNHMRAFSRNLNALGESYTPAFISETDYATILNSSHNAGKRRRNGAGGNGQCVN